MEEVLAVKLIMTLLLYASSNQRCNVAQITIYIARVVLKLTTVITEKKKKKKKKKPSKEISTKRYREGEKIGQR